MQTAQFHRVHEGTDILDAELLLVSDGQGESLDMSYRPVPLLEKLYQEGEVASSEVQHQFP